MITAFVASLMRDQEQLRMEYVEYQTSLNTATTEYGLSLMREKELKRQAYAEFQMSQM